MKEYTTPTITWTFDGCEDIINASRTIVVTMKNGKKEIDFDPSIVVRTTKAANGTTKYVKDTIKWSLTQRETAELCGTCQVEATFKGKDDSVVKSNTESIFIKPSVKKGEM